MRHVWAGVGLMVAVASAFGCAQADGSDSNELADPTAPAATTETPASPGATPDAPAAPAPKAPNVDDPGPPPAGGCSLSPDGDGFFVRDSGKGSYVGYVPASYTGKPTRLLVGMHGCGDAAYNFATWAVNPWATRDTQDYIGISIDGASGGGSCWKNADAAKVLAAIDDISQCLYVHKQKVVISGFSSGGELAYSLGLSHASRFAGVLILNSTLSAAGDASALLGGAAYHIPIAHRAHKQDSVFPIATVHSDWSTIRNAGFTLDTSEVDGDHDGTSDDWTDWLLPRMESWKAP
jgi:hypothetical protein